MALKRKRTNSPVGMKSQIYSQLQSNVHFLSPSSGTSWSSISSAVSSSTDTISVDEPNTPQNDSPTLNVRNNTRLRKAVFDRYGTTSTASTSSIAMSVDSWRMEVDDQGNDGHDAHTSTASSGFESHSMMETEVEVGLEVDENPSGRTRKRLRDNRPDETVIHGKNEFTSRPLKLNCVIIHLLASLCLQLMCREYPQKIIRRSA